jgi:hypothetical protein
MDILVYKTTDKCSRIQSLRVQLYNLRLKTKMCLENTTTIHAITSDKKKYNGSDDRDPMISHKFLLYQFTTSLL